MVGDTDDWIELYNTGDTDFDLGGYYISDDVDKRFVKDDVSLVLAAGVVVPKKGVLLLWADGQPAQGTLKAPHLSFKLSADGEGVWLSNPAGYLVDSIEFGKIPPKVAETERGSLARFPDGTGPFQWCSHYSPEKVNGDHCTGESL
jgi:hypothetical protein